MMILLIVALKSDRFFKPGSHDIFCHAFPLFSAIFPCIVQHLATFFIHHYMPHFLLSPEIFILNKLDCGVTSSVLDILRFQSVLIIWMSFLSRLRLHWRVQRSSTILLMLLWKLTSRFFHSLLMSSNSFAFSISINFTIRYSYLLCG